MTPDFRHEAETCCRQVCDAMGALPNILATEIIRRALIEAALAERRQLHESIEEAIRNYAEMEPDFRDPEDVLRSVLPDLSS